SYFCCGRKTPLERKPVNGTQRQAKQRLLNRNGVRVIEDQFHPRGFRELCSQAELNRRKHKLLSQGIRNCFYCGEEFIDYREIVVAHKEPKGMGGARHDDHISNLTLSHKLCNLENGSRRVA